MKGFFFVQTAAPTALKNRQAQYSAKFDFSLLVAAFRRGVEFAPSYDSSGDIGWTRSFGKFVEIACE